MNNGNFIICKDVKTKEKLIKQGFQLLSSKKNIKNEEVFTFINNPTISINFSKEDNEGLIYTSIMYF